MFTRNARSVAHRLPALRNARGLHASPIARGVQELTREPVDTPLSLWNFTEEEQMIRETCRRFAQDVVAPKVREMDENEKMDPVCPNLSCEQRPS